MALNSRRSNDEVCGAEQYLESCMSVEEVRFSIEAGLMHALGLYYEETQSNWAVESFGAFEEMKNEEVQSGMVGVSWVNRRMSARGSVKSRPGYVVRSLSLTSGFLRGLVGQKKQ